MKHRTFGHHFTRYLALTLVVSIVCTAAVWAGSWLLFFNFDVLNPANHYERQIPDIVEFVERNEGRVLSPTFRSELERIIPPEGIEYQIVDPAGIVLYGSLAKPVLFGKDDVVRKLNTTEASDGSFVAHHPVMGEDGGLGGVLVLAYEMSLVASNRSRTIIARAFLIGNMLVPFLFIVLFAIVFARGLGRRFEPSIRRLVEAAERICRQDLDFNVADVAGSTELAQLSTAFDDMRAALRHSLHTQWQIEQERRDMVASLRHELQTPLTIIRGHVDNLLANEKKRAERLAAYLLTIKNNTDRATRLVNDLSDLEQVDEVRFSVVPQLTDVGAFFQQMLEEYRSRCAAAGVQLVYNLRVRGRDADRGRSGDGDPGEQDGWGGHDRLGPHDGWLHVDAHRLDQILANLMDNSLRVTPVGGRIRWNVQLTGDRLVLRMCDTGPGFSETDLQRVFDRFYQGEAARSHSPGRMGLGLYIVRKLAEKHGGTVSAANRASGGACVTVELKAAPRAVVPRDRTSRLSTPIQGAPCDTASTTRH